MQRLCHPLPPGQLPQCAAIRQIRAAQAPGTALTSASRGERGEEAAELCACLEGHGQPRHTGEAGTELLV